MSDTNKNILDKTANKGLLRKKFLKYPGTSAATVLAFGFTACSDYNPMGMDNDENENQMVNLGSGDLGVLNYAYVLEQLEAAFYIAVLDSAYSGNEF